MLDELARNVLQVASGVGGKPGHLSYLRGGRGKPILLLHGFASNAAEDWLATGWFDALVSTGYDVVAPDLRGHGVSFKSREKADYRLNEFANDVEFLCRYCWGDRRFDLVGYSMGAHVAMAVAIEAPSRIGKIILGGMGARIADNPGLPPEFALALEEVRIDRHVKRSSYAEKFRQYAASRAFNDLPALAACLRGQAGCFDFSPLAALPAPALVIVGENDGLAGDPTPVAARFATGTAVIVSGTDHSSALADISFRDQILQFLGGGLTQNVAT